MIHPNTELRFISPLKGYGVVATQFIPKGTITWVQDRLDRIFTQTEVAQLEPMYQDILNTYTFRNKEGEYVLCWDNARFVNHSYNSSCMSTAYDFEIAIRDIHPGEELTDDYGYLNVTEPFAAEPEDGTDRSMVLPDDLLRLHPIWDEKIQEAFPYIKTVDQPLWGVISPEIKKQIHSIIEEGKEPASILECYYAGK